MVVDDSSLSSTRDPSLYVQYSTKAGYCCSFHPILPFILFYFVFILFLFFSFWMPSTVQLLSS